MECGISKVIGLIDVEGDLSLPVLEQVDGSFDVVV
jgi:hypothetical protein